MKVLHSEGGGGDHISLGVSIPNPNSVAHSYNQPAVLEIKINNIPIREVVSIKLWGATGGTFTLVYFIPKSGDVEEYKKITDDLDWNSSASTVASKIKKATSWSTSAERRDLDASGAVTTVAEDVKGYEWIVTYTVYKDKDINPLLTTSKL